MSIQVQSVTKLYGEQKALDSVSFSIEQGEVVGFLGPNGAGKSTMMKIISCFLEPTSGDVLVGGQSVLNNSMEVRRIVGYLPENNPLYLEMYVKEYLGFVAGLYKISDSKKRVAEMIEMTGLGLEQGKKIGALSKGYRQRVGIAQALIHDPKVLILDEPTSGLDPNQLNEIRNLIIEVGKEKTVMLSTHIMQEVESVCDRVIIIDRGILLANQSVAEIQKGKSNEQVVVVEFDNPVDLEELKKIDGVDKVVAKTSSVFVLSSSQNKDIRPLIFQYAVDHKLSVLSMNQEKKSLEEVFKELTKS